jgi:hypothetical protein
MVMMKMYSMMNRYLGGALRKKRQKEKQYDQRQGYRIVYSLKQ